jgi:tetraacyldisaccharide 4'-kinase
LNPLARLYGAVVGVRNGLYDRGTLQVRRLQGPVVSIGNLAVGGSGKTPFLILLGELLQQRGVAFDVVSRGYGRATKGVALVDLAGSPRDFGDEPLLIARKLRVPVIVGEDRYAAGQFAERRFGPRLHLLDDGFQHRRLARDFDIVLITSTDANDTLLPTGRLREPLSALTRADAVVLTNNTSTDGLQLASQCVWRVSRGMVAPAIRDKCVAFCGIARPDNFFAELGSAGVTLAGTKAFDDHHAYTRSDIGRLLALRRRNAANAFITTEKDAINLGLLAEELAPLHIVPVTMDLAEPEAALDALLSRIACHAPHETI